MQPLQFQSLSGEALDREHPPQVVGKPGGEVARSGPHLPVTRRQLPLKMQRSPKNHRNRQVGEQGNLRRHHRHADAHHQHGGDQLQDLIGTAIQKAFELIDVVIEHRHQATGAVLLEKGQLQLLQMVVSLEPQAVLGGLRQVAPEHVVEVLE